MSYASAYKGAGRNGYIHTTSSARSHTVSSGLAQAPIASMTSTGSSIHRGIAYNSASSVAASSVQGIRTSASHVSGGMTSGETYAHISLTGRRKALGDPDNPPAPGDEGYCPGCTGCYVWDATAGDWYCPECDCYLMDGCECGEHCHCNVPIGDGKEVWLFLAGLAVAYTVYKNAKKEEKVQVI